MEGSSVEVGLAIRKLRKERGLTQAELASAVGVSCRTIQKAEKDAVVPSHDTIVRVANALGVSTSLLNIKEPTRYAEETLFIMHNMSVSDQILANAVAKTIREHRNTHTI